MYGGRGTANDILACISLAEQQILVDQQEVLDCARYKEVPVYHRERWYKLAVRRSELALRIPEYGEDRHYGDGTQYGVPDANAEHVIDLDTAKPVAELPMICSDITRGGVLWYHGVDYVFDRDSQEIRLLANPFDSVEFVRRPVYEDGVEVDEELDLWFHQSEWDWNYLYDHFGYLFGLTGLVSSPAAKRIVTVLYEAVVGGCGRAAVEDLIAACADIPLTATAGEVVEGIYYTDATIVCTDKNVYRLSAEATLSVEVGDELEEGQSLSNGLKIFRLNRGETPDELSVVTVDSRILGGDYFDTVSFFNQETPLIVEENVDGKTKVSFALGGFGPDVDTFWAEVHRRGLLNNRTLAEALDLREAPEDQPTAASLPATINPLHFVVENILRFNALAALVRMNQLGPHADIARLQTLRMIIPPWNNLLLILLAETSQDPVTITAVESETETSYSAATTQDAYDTDVTSETRSGYTNFSCR